MPKIIRETYNSRVKRGWCLERAANVVAIPTKVKCGSKAPTDAFLFIKDLTRLPNDGYTPMFEATCCCGSKMTLTERQLFQDVHCGCITGHTSPDVLKRLDELEIKVGMAIPTRK